jgi:hypothetical protein
MGRRRELDAVHSVCGCAPSGRTGAQHCTVQAPALSPARALFGSKNLFSLLDFDIVIFLSIFSNSVL